MIDNWEALDKKTNGKVTAFTYIVLWLHDRVYSHSTDLYYEVRKSKYYRHAVKKTVNEIYNEASVACNENFSILGKSALFLSEVNGNVSGSMEKHIMVYKYAVQQALLDAGVGGEANELASQASVVNMLAQVLSYVIDDFRRMALTPWRVKNNPLEYMKQEPIRYKTQKLANLLADNREAVNLNKSKRVVDAFSCFTNALFAGGVFGSAIEKAEKEIEEVEKIAYQE